MPCFQCGWLLDYCLQFSVFVGSSVDYFLCFCPNVDYFLDSINKAAIGLQLDLLFVSIP